MDPLLAVAWVACGLQAVLAVTVWSMLHQRWSRRPLALWVTGSMLLGVGGFLILSDDFLPYWASVVLANALLSLSPALRIAALRIDLGRAPCLGWLLALAALDLGSFLALHTWTPPAVHVPAGLLQMAAWTLGLAWYGAAAGRQLRSRAGWVLADVEILFALALGLRVWGMVRGWSDHALVAHDLSFGFLVLAALAATLYGNLAYLGLAMDRINQAIAQAREAQLHEAWRREAAEAHSQALQRLLDQRNWLAEERDRLLQMLAYAVRQPLHGAKAALAVALQRLGLAPEMAVSAVVAAADAADLQVPLRAAQQVLDNMHVQLDNTLAAAKLLGADAAPARHEVDLALLLSLVQGDLSLAQQARVQLQRQDDCRTVLCEPTLLRLALRNLLLNALTHGGDAGPVCLQTWEQESPPALVFTVLDQGPGLAGGAPVPDGKAVPHTGERLGLYVVQRVAAVHGGTLHLTQNQPRGVSARLLVSQLDA